MDAPLFTAADLETLRQWDTPTICNGLELIEPGLVFEAVPMASPPAPPAAPAPPENGSPPPPPMPPVAATVTVVFALLSSSRCRRR